MQSKFFHESHVKSHIHDVLHRDDALQSNSCILSPTDTHLLQSIHLNPSLKFQREGSVWGSSHFLEIPGTGWISLSLLWRKYFTINLDNSLSIFISFLHWSLSIVLVLKETTQQVLNFYVFVISLLVAKATVFSKCVGSRLMEL